MRSAWRCTIVAGLTLTTTFSAALFSVHEGAAQYPWNYEPVADDGGEISIAVDSTGRIHAAFARSVGSSWELAYALKTGSSWSFQRVDAQSEGPSLVLDSSEEPRISYYRASDNTLRYAYRVGTSFVNETVEQVNCTAYTTSLALDLRGPVHITYWDYCNPSPYLDYLRHAVRNESGWMVETVGTGFIDPSDRAPVEVDSAGHPHIAVQNFLGGEPPGGVRYLSWNGSGWLNEQASSPSDGTELDEVSLKLDSNDVPHIVYRDETYERHRYARYKAMFRTWLHQDVYVWPPSSFHIGFGRISLALDWRNLPSVSFMDHTDGSLMYAYSDGTNWFAENVQASPGISGYLALGLDSLGAPHIMYGQVTMPNPSQLPVAHAWQVWPDNVPPSSKVDATKPYWRNSNPIQITAQAKDPGSGLANVTLWFRHSADNLTWGTWAGFGNLVAPPWAWSFTFPAGEGYYEFYTTAVDNVGNAEPPPPTADAITGYDITPPVSTALMISPYWHTTPSLTVNATATDNLSGVAEVTLFYSHAPLDNSTWTPWTWLGTRTTEPWSWSFSFPNGEGHYRFHTIAHDVAGNFEGGKDYSEAIAGYRTPPDYTPVNPLPSSPLTVGLSLPLQLSIEVLNAGGFENINATLTFHNESSPSSPLFTAQVPPIPVGSTSGPFTATWISPAAPCACHVVANVDFFDNVTESNETNNNYTWTINVVPGPMTSFSVGEPNYTTAETYVTSLTPILMTAIDQSGTGILRTMYSIDGDPWRGYSITGQFTLTGEGEHSVRYYSEDNAGNVEATSTTVIRVDNTPPTTFHSVGSPKYQSNEMYVTSSTAINLTSADSGLTPVGLDVIEYRTGGGQWLAYSSDFTLAGSDGIHAIEYRSRDLLNNSEAVKSLTVFLDDAPPATTISPATGEFTTNTLFNLTATDSGCGVNVTRYRIDGGSWLDYASGFTLTEGEHTIHYYSIDNLGNIEQEKSLVVRSPVEVAVNYKPLVALVFAVILAVFGLLSSKKRPWKGGKDRKAVLKAFIVFSLPFVLAEAVTGVVSFATGQLSIPPLFEAGTNIDLTILMAGLVVSLARVSKTIPPEAESAMEQND